MLEILIFGGGDGDNYLPNSGPGNKRLLQGSKHEGWLGLVDVTLMPSIYQTAAALNITVNPFTGSNPAVPRWLKAVIDDKVIFVPNGPWTDTIDFSDLYRAGGVYGVDDVGPDGRYPTNVFATNQLRYIDWIDPEGRAWLFKIRLIKGNDPVYVASQSSTTAASCEISEYWRLFGRVIQNSTVAASDRWDNLVINVDYKNFTFHDQTFTSGAYHRINDFLKPAAGSWGQSGFSQLYGWLPVLEVVDTTETFVYPIGVTFTTPKAKPINSTVVQGTDLIAPSNILFSNHVVSGINTTANSDTLVAPTTPIFNGTSVVSMRPTIN